MSNVLETPNCVSCCSFVVVFATKYRRAVLTKPIQTRLHGLVNNAQTSLGYKILASHIDTDHVTLTIACDPDIGVSAITTKLKQHTASVLRREFPELKSRLPCLWTRSKLVVSLGSRDENLIAAYLEDQHNV